MIWMRMIKANDIFSAFAAFALDADQFLWIDAIAVVWRVVARVAAAGDRSNDARAVAIELTQQNTAALVRIGFFAVPAQRFETCFVYFQHWENQPRRHRVTERARNIVSP